MLEGRKLTHDLWVKPEKGNSLENKLISLGGSGVLSDVSDL